MTGSSAETAPRDMRRFIEISFGYIAWMSAVVLVVAGVQAIRVGLFSLDHAILLAGAVLSIVSGTYLYVVHVRRVDQSSPMTHLSLSHAFLIGGAETCVFFFGLYLLLFRGLYRLYVLVGDFHARELLSALGFIFLASVLLNGFRRLRKVGDFLNRLEDTLIRSR